MGDRERWISLLESAGAIQNGHFLLSSGRHSEGYIQCALALEHPDNAALLGQGIADRIQTPVDRVLAPPLGGLIIGYEVARHLDVPFAFPEGDSVGKLILGRGFELHPKERICLVEDVITTGKTTRELLEVIHRLGALPVAIGAIVDRSKTHWLDALPIRSLLRLEIPTFSTEACPLCQTGIPLNQPGSRKMMTQGEV
ncbi:orotate phosphoribosyltransferase [Candidatus Bipolaricaulota bacterium]